MAWLSMAFLQMNFKDFQGVSIRKGLRHQGLLASVGIHLSGGWKSKAEPIAPTWRWCSVTEAVFKNNKIRLNETEFNFKNKRLV